MAKGKSAAAVIEWSPDGCLAWTGNQSHVKSGATISDVAHDFSGHSIILGIARTSCFIRTLKIPTASKQDTAMLIKNRIGTLFPVPMNQLAYDFACYPSADHRSQTVLVAGMRSDLLQEAKKQADEAGVKILATLPAAISAPLVVAESGLESASLIQTLDSGLAIDIIGEGVLQYSRIVPVADNAKAEVDRTFTAAGTDCLPTVSVGDAYMGADHYVSNGTLNSLLKLDIAHLPLNIELHETRVARENDAIKGATRLASTALIASIVIAGFVGYGWYSAKNSLTSQTNQLNKDISGLQNHKKKVDDIWTGISPVSELVKRAYKPAQRYSDVLQILSADAPKDIWIKSFSVQRGNPFTLQGVSLSSASVANYVQKLSSESRLRDVQLLFANKGTMDKTTTVQFSITGFPVGNIPLSDKTKKGGA